MPSLAEIEQQLNMCGLDKLFGRKEIKELPNILWDNEQVKKAVQGIYNSSFGMLVATDTRIIFVDKGFLVGLRVEDFALDKISSIEYDLGFIMGDITIYTSNNKAVIKSVPKQEARDFCDYVRNAVSGQKSTLKAASTGKTNNISEEIERLFKLKEIGAISENEFQESKAKLLKLL
ncbi:MAG: PH domain-containing protein [Azoarcus sp.]|jgi:hypothetical protein|nr:PH domain-containing protein [Azoarcus sp.]